MRRRLIAVSRGRDTLLHSGASARYQQRVLSSAGLPQTPGSGFARGAVASTPSLSVAAPMRREWSGFHPERERKQRERESAWRAFTLTMRDVRRVVGLSQRSPVDGAPQCDDGLGASDSLASRAQTALADRHLLDALGVTDLQSALNTMDARTVGAAAAGDSDSAPTHSAGGGPAGWLHTSPGNAQELRPLVTRACRAAVKADVAPMIALERLLAVVVCGSPRAGESDTSRLLFPPDGAGVLADLLQPLQQPLGAAATGEAGRERWYAALDLFDAHSIALLLQAQASRLETHVGWARQRLRDSRSPAAESPLRLGAVADELCGGCGPAAALQFQLLVEHRHAQQLLDFFEPRLAPRVGDSVAVPLPALEAGLRLCASMAGGQGAARAVAWVEAALARAEDLLSDAEYAHDKDEVLVSASERLLECLRGHLARCCAAALSAAATGESCGGGGGGGASPRSPGAGTFISFETCYGLAARLASALQRASDAVERAAGASASGDASGASCEPLARRSGGSARPLADTFTAFADVTLLLLPTLADVLATRGGVQHFASLRAMFAAILTETDAGYELATVPQVRQCTCALLHALAAVPMEAASRCEAVESLWWTVTHNARVEVWEDETVTLQLLAGQAAAAVSCSAGGPDAWRAMELSPPEQRTHVLLNKLLEPRTRALGERESSLGVAVLAAPLTGVDRDVQRLLSYAVQRFPISMDTAHALVAKLLLRDALVTSAPAPTTAVSKSSSTSSSSIIYHVLDTVVGCQRDGADTHAARTFLLRLLTFAVDLHSRVGQRARDGGVDSALTDSSATMQGIHDAHASHILAAWLTELRDHGVHTVGVTTVLLMMDTLDVLRGLPSTAAAPLTCAVLEEAVDALSRGLVDSGTAASAPVAGQAVTAAGGRPTDQRVSSATLVAPDDPSVQCVLSFPDDFTAAHCTGPGSPWSAADVHAFLTGVRRLLATRAGAALTLRDYAVLRKLDAFVFRHGMSGALTLTPSPLPVAVCVLRPLGASRGAAVVSVEAELGLSIPGAHVPPAVLGVAKDALSVRWLCALVEDEGPAEGHAVVGGADVGLSWEPLFPAQLRSLLANFREEQQRRRVRRAVSEQGWSDEEEAGAGDDAEGSGGPLAHPHGKDGGLSRGEPSVADEGRVRPPARRRRASLMETVMFEQSG